LQSLCSPVLSVFEHLDVSVTSLGYGPSATDLRRRCSPPILAASSRTMKGSCRHRQHISDSACLSSPVLPLRDLSVTRKAGHRKGSSSNTPAPSWFLNCLGSGESRPELSGDTDRRPAAGSRGIVPGISFQADMPRTRGVRLSVLEEQR
jgi:hypothetical protein